MAGEPFFPVELIRKCDGIVEPMARSIEIRALAAKVAQRRNIAALKVVGEGKATMGSAVVASRVRLSCSITAIAFLIGALFLSRWYIIGTAVATIAGWHFWRQQRRSWLRLTSMLLALDVLSENFAGWGDTYPALKARADELLAGQDRMWIDEFIRVRADVAHGLQEAFASANR